MSEIVKPIYLDYAATTPVDPRVMEAMMPYFTQHFGNPSSNHHHGQIAAAAVENARQQLATAINAKPQEIIFTSGATEAINLAIKGVALANESKGKHFITVATEHKAVLDCFGWLEDNGYETTILPVDSDGILDLQDLIDAIRPDTVMASVMMVNNETGVIQDMADIGKICREREVYFMTDATQGLGKEEIDIKAMHIDLLAASSHKIYGPKGVGMLYASRSNPRIRMSPIIHGGGHEKGLRSGTLPTALIVGFGKAAEVIIFELLPTKILFRTIQQSLLDSFFSFSEKFSLNGHKISRNEGIINLTLAPVDSEALVASLSKYLTFSTGSACTSSESYPSHVLKAMNCSFQHAVRLSVGKPTTLIETDSAFENITREWARLADITI